MNTKLPMLCLSFVSLSLFAGCGSTEQKTESTSTTSVNALALTTRESAYPIERLILHRWSPRAMSGESISDQELNQLFEAARWAPSGYNNQPWRFIYAKRDTQAWDTIFNLMVDFNKRWAKNAAVLMVLVSQERTEKNQPIPTHTFDAGAAWENLALQAASMGLVAHAMSGFDYAKAKEVLHIPDGYTVEAMIAVGKPGTLDTLPEEMRASEMPKDRKSIETFVHEGEFKQ